MAGELRGVWSANWRRDLPGDLLIAPGSRATRKLPENFPASHAKSSRLIPAVRIGFPFAPSLRLPAILDTGLALPFARLAKPSQQYDATVVPCPSSTSRRGGSERPVWIVLHVSKKLSSTYFILRLHSALSIGHGFGGIPAPCGFVSSAFPFPPKNSSRTAAKTFCAPPEMQTLALGADPSRFQVPQLQGQKMETHKCTKIASNSWAF